MDLDPEHKAERTDGSRRPASQQLSSTVRRLSSAGGGSTRRVTGEKEARDFLVDERASEALPL